APISTASVDVHLSTDGGQTFPTVLVAGTPNDGSQSIIVPNTPTTTARVRVRGAANVFFDISDANFTIQAGTPQPAMSPAALAVDAGGNGVLQPGETASMAPAWLNSGTAALVNGSGLLANFTGPGGPTYTVNDGVAAYGTINPGATVSCTSTANCYALSITATARPTQHWDATVLETLSPGASTKTWTLHVGDSFTDVPDSNPYYRFIETMFHRGLTGGCGGGAYCPGGATAREQMSVFVLRAKDPALTPPACSPPNLFADVPETSPFCRWIEELARRNVVGGCGGGNFCPSAAVTREQMAVFVLRTLDPALNPPACGTPVFADVPASSPFCRWIEELVRRGVVTGCGGGNYCPGDPVTREQMGVFLVQTFGLTLYAP
ncbi:MAG TPA: S-layer homology domain-containing protein, partial [Vicinamibacteria bacterium]|nr:S-layer homology domain-containing protein [Vicinamibacteria bacterium]